MKNSEIKIELLDSHGVFTLGTTQFLFDLEDLPLIQGRSWYQDKDGYLVSSYLFEGKRRFVRFHRIIMHAQPQQCVDHINKCKWDNRKQNLRLCHRIENDRNRKVYSTNKSGISGVYFDRQRGKWTASITCNRQKQFIGRFDVKEDAIKARLEKEMELFQEFAPQRALWETLTAQSS